MNYTEPYILLLVPAVLILILFLYAAAARRKKRLLAALLGNNADDPDSLHLSKTARLWKLILYLAGAAVIICGIARPYWKKLPLPLKSSGRDIIVLFDVSKSMRATDLPPSRMEQAKFLLREIVNASPGDRFALIAFAGNAFLSCPLTADHTAFNEYINELDTDTVPLGGTNIERALRSADRALKSAESSANAVLMLTDGDALSGNAERLVADFKSSGIPLIIAGFGDPAVAAPVPDGQGGFIRQSDNSVASSKLNETALAHLAARTGGIYVRSTVGDTGFAAIESALQKLTRRERQSGTSYQIDDKFPWFFAAGFILLLIAGVISEAPGKNSRIPNKAKNLILILLLGVSALTNAGETAPKQQDPPLPENALQLYNLARERQINGDDSAAALYEEVISKAAGNQDLQNRALHNLGTASHSAGRTIAGKAQQLLSAQQPDAALEQLKGAEAKFNNSKSLYDQVLNTEHPVAVSSGSNLRQLELDLQQLQKLKKQIEELKKQQQDARKQTQNALDQQKQQNQQQQNKSDKQDQKNQQNQQNQQIRQAAQSAAELEKQAADLKQEKLRQNAAGARKELEEAARKQQQDPASKDIQKHLENAAKSLGKPESEPKEQPSDKQGDKKNQKEEKNSAGAENSAEQRRQEKQRNAEQQLQMLDDETAPMRKNLRQRNSRGTPLKKVDKDW